MTDRENKAHIPTPETAPTGDSADKTMYCRLHADPVPRAGNLGNSETSPMCQVRTDMAAECVGAVQEQIEGVETSESLHSHGIKLTRVNITSREASESLGKPEGTYLTVDMPLDASTANEAAAYDTCVDLCARCIRELAGHLPTDAPIMVLGLGNRYVTADSLGTKVTEQVLVTRHMWDAVPEEITRGLRSMCAIAPGVMGITGIETAETVKGLVEMVKPCLVLAIDALASRSVERLGRSVQFSDSGIVPGSGVGNRRVELSKNTLGVPVIAVGVPTVVDAATLAVDAVELTVTGLREQLDKAEHREGDPELFGLLDNLTPHQKQLLFREVLYPRIGDMVVTPKDVDALIEKMSAVISAAINQAFHGVNTRKQAEEYIWTNVE